MKVITTHKNPDFDAISSCIAAKKLYNEAVIVFPDLPERSTKNFIIQSIIYPYLENGDVDIKSIETLIVVDTHSKKRIEDKFAQTADDVYTICYDHHEEGDIKCNECYLRKLGANTTQMIERILERNIEITEDEATLFMLGIYEDTGKLSYSSTTPEDIFIASKLLEKGADLDTIRNILSETLSEIEVVLLNDLIKNKRIYEINNKKIALSFASMDEYVSNVAGMVSKFMSIDKLDAAICIFRMESRIYVIGRSNKNIDVSLILKEVGGGGHKQAASAVVKEKTLIEVAEKLSYSIKMNLLSRVTAKDIMSFPPKFVYADDTLEKVNDTISKSGMNALVVVDRNTLAVVGIVTRQIINKAIYHHMNKEKISMFTITEFESVLETDTFDNIKRLVIDEKQRLIPVLSKDGKLTGVITRTNLLQILSSEQDKEQLRKTRNIKHEIRKMLPLNIVEYLIKAGEIAKQLSFKAYMVGGVVRDIILGYENLDIDIVIEGNGIEFANRFAKEYSAKVAAHKEFQTATIIMKDGLRVDVATAREEYYDLPGSLPNVEQSSLKLDLYRRDFTINTLAVKLHDEFGDLLDFFGSLRDIKEKKIRVLHMLSFVEDPTRIFRAVRFASRLGFEIGKQTDKLIKVSFDLGILRYIDKPRVFNEIKYILESNCVRCSFEMMRKYRLLYSLDKRIVIDDRILKHLELLENIVASYATVWQDKKIDRKAAFLMLLEYLLRKSVSFAETIGVDEKTSGIIKKNVYKFPAAIKIIKNPESNNYEVYHALDGLTIEGVLCLYAIEKDNEKIRHYLEHLMSMQPVIRGKDLLDLGFKPSEIFSVIIKDIFKKQLLDIIKEKKEAVEYILKHYKKHIK